MSDELWDAAVREAIATAPSDVVILETVELIHPAFVDDDGNPTAIRVVRHEPHTETWLQQQPDAVAAVLDALDAEARSLVGLVARLEDDAPRDAGAYVSFVSLSFELDLPTEDSERIQEVDFAIDNVGREILDHLDAANLSQQAVEIRYRPYLSTDITVPRMHPPMLFELGPVEADVFSIRGRARVFDLGQRAFPSDVYTAAAYPGLAR